MAINLSKITTDLENRDPQIKTFALISVTRLSPTLVDDAPQVRGLFGRLEELIRSDNPDVVFLARKASNHLRAQFKAMLGDEAGAPAARPPTESDPAKMDRSQLVAALSDPALQPMELATIIIRLVDKGQPEDLKALIPFLQHANDRVRSNALEVFVKHGGPEHVELVRPLASDPSNRARGTALLALDRFGADISGPISEMLELPAISMRETAVWVLSQIESARACRLLVKALDDPYDGIRLRAVRALARYPNRDAVAALKSALNDIDINICEAAAESLRALKVLIQGRAQAQKQAAEADAGSAAPEPAEGAAVDSLAADAPTASDEPRTAEAPAAAAGSGAGGGPSPRVLEARRELGTAIYQLCRLNEVTHEELDRTFYEILRYQDFLRSFLIRKQKGEKMGGDAPDASQAIRQLQQKIASAFVELGEIAEKLLASGEIRVPSEKQPEIGGLLARLRDG